MKSTRFICARIMALVLLMVTTVVSNAQTTLVDEMPYTYDVTSTGAFTYSLPIRIPPGIKDMMPELAITYNSQANNGLMGMGWSLSGLSSITRTPSTLYHHSELKSIDYSNADNFSLDGMPLYKDASTGYYMTWIKNYSKIQAYDPGTGIANWTVQSTDGLTYEYGNSSASLRYTGGKILAYALDKVTDKYGNYISFEYIQDVNKGTLQISKISYNANSAIPSLPTTEISFNYITKSVTNKAWVGSASFIDDILLSGIEVKHNGIVVNKYELTYALTASVYHLTKIEEIRGSYTVPPIVINWNNDPVTPAQEAPFASANTGAANFAVLDYNGDGFADYTKSGISSTLELYTNTQDGLFSMQTITRSYAAVGGVIGSNYQMRVDMNGDGFEDLLTDVLIENGPTDWQRKIYYHESIGTTLSAGTEIFSYRNVAGGSGSAGAWASAMKVIPGDFDGDGKTELFVLVPASMGSAGPPPSMPNDFFSYIIDMSYNFHGETLPGSTVGAIYGNYAYAGNVTGMINALVPMDHDGNGKDDIVIVYNATGTATYIYNVNFAYTGSGNTVAMSTGTAPTLSVITSSIYPTKDHAQWHVGDFNGDGKKDALIWKPVGASGRWDIVYSEANGLSLQAPSTNLQAGLMDGGEPNWPNTICVKVADFNGDGKDDILRLENTHGLGTLGPVSYKIFYATGYDYTTHRGTFTLESETDKFNNISAHGGSVEIGDFNGDGHVDLFSHYNGNSATTPGIAFFYKDDLRHTVNMIEHGVKKLNIGIDFLPQRQGNSHNFRRKAVTPATYPYISKVLPIKITNGVADNANIYNKAYVYEESIINVVGLGMMGFSRMSVIDHPSGLVRENVYSNLSDVENPIPFVKEWRDWTTMDWNNYYFNGVPIGFPNNSPSAMGGSTYNNNNGGCAGRVRMVTLNNSTDFQLHTGIYKTNTPSYSTTIGSIGYEYGQPDVVVSTNGPCTTTVNYTYNLSAPLHYVAKPVTCTTSTQRFSQPAYTRISNYQYNAQGQLSTLTGDPGTSNEKVVQYAYDGWGNLASDITTATGVAGAISHSYNATTDGRFVQRSFNPQNVPSEFTYNIWGKVLTENGPSNNDDITYEYNAFNRLTKKTDVSTGIYTIYDFGLATGMADAVVPESKYYASTSTVGISGTNIEFYDMYMRKLRTVSTGYNGQKLYKDYVYQWGVLQFETNMYDPANSSTKVTTQYDYDKWYRHRKISTVPASQETYMSYVFYQTPIPRLETTIETVSGASKVVTTDESGATMKIVDNGGNTIEFDYHSNGQLERQKMNGNAALQTFNQYDNFGHLTQSTKPNEGTTTYVTNALDQVTSKTDALGNVYTYTYDNMGRVITMGEKAAGSSSVFFYNNIYDNLPGSPQYGKLLQKTSPHGTNLNYGYDMEGNVSNITENEGGTTFGTQYIYDAYGRVQQQTYPSGIVTANDYNSYGYLESVNMINGGPGLAGQKLWTANTINHSGQTTQATYYDGLSQPLYTMNHTYTDLGHLVTSQLTSTLTPNPLIDMSYDFDPVTGNLNERNDDIKGLTDNFTYDIEFDRLKSVTGPVPPTVQIQYSAEGNILKRKDVSNNNYSWAYNGYAIKQVARLGATNFAIPLPDQIETYYPFKKVKTLEESNQVHAFNYWPDWQRSKMTITNKSTSTLLSTKYYATNTERIIDAATGNQEDNTYIFANGACIAIVQSKTGATPKLYFPMTDYLGSITHIFDNVGLVNGGLVEERSFDAWGRPRNPNTWVAYATTAMPTWKFARGYTGHEHLLNKNIINMNGRLYDPLVGRMLSPDPLIADASNSQAYNRYSYAMNNPLKYTDPDGNLPIVAAMAIGGVINLAINYKHVQSFGDGAAYFGIGAVGGLFGGAGVGFSGTVAGAFMGAYITTSYNNIANGGTNFMQSGLKAGVYSGMATAGMYGLSYGLSSLRRKPVINEYTQNVTADPAKVAQYKADALAWNDSPLRLQYDERLNAAMNRFRVRPYTNATTKVPTDFGYGLDISTNKMVNLRDAGYTRGLTIGYGPNHIDVHISPFYVDQIGTIKDYAFTAVAGHELVHAYHMTKYLRAYSGPRSEPAAWKFSASVYQGVDISEYNTSIQTIDGFKLLYPESMQYPVWDPLNPYQP